MRPVVFVISAVMGSLRNEVLAAVHDLGEPYPDKLPPTEALARLRRENASGARLVPTIPHALEQRNDSMRAASVANASQLLEQPATDEDPDASAESEEGREKVLADAGAATVPPTIDTEPDALHEPPLDKVKQRKEAFDAELDAHNPLLTRKNSVFFTPLLICVGVASIALLAYLHMTAEDTDVDETEIELPENMYGQALAELVMAGHYYKKSGGVSMSGVCELISSLALLVVTYFGVFAMIIVARATLADIDQDVAERDTLFDKFEDPTTWQHRNWNEYPDATWRRDSMVWYCHDIIYGKARHVNNLGPQFYMFNWVVLIIWWAYMLEELRECLKFKIIIWDVPSVPFSEQVTVDKEEGRIRVAGLGIFVKITATLIILIPKLLLNLTTLYVGCLFLLYNDLDDSLQDILLKTIELAFILEMDELVFASFVAHHKKQQLSQMEMPLAENSGVSRSLSRFGELPRLIMIVAIATYLCAHVNDVEKSKRTLTHRQAQVVEGCCNFMQYVRGAGEKSTLADANPCTIFRATYFPDYGVDVTGGLIAPGETHAPGAATASTGMG